MPIRILAIVVSCAVLLTASLALASCGSRATSGTPTTGQEVTTQTVTTEISRGSTTTTTPEAYESMTTSEALGIAAGKGTDLVQHLGDAAIYYLSGKGDLSAAQQLVAPSAQDGLARMLSSLGRPNGCKVMRMAQYGLSKEIDVDLLFAGGASEPADFTVTIAVDPGKGTMTITAIQPGLSVDPYTPPPSVPTTLSTTGTQITTGSSLPVIQIQAEPALDYTIPNYSYFTAETVALVKVVNVLPLRRNPLAGTGDQGEPSEHQPMVYKGYVLQVEKAYGPDTIPERITVYALGNGMVVLDGVTYEVRDEFPLDTSPGDRLFVPLVKIAYFGTPALKKNEYWVQANWAVFAVDGSGNCARAAGADVDPENRSKFTLSELENIVLEQGKKPSLVE